MITVPLDQFDTVFEKICNEKKKCVMLFTSDQDENGNYWCPFCEKIVIYYPILEKQASKLNLQIYRFLAGDQETWKNQEHKFKKNPLTKIKSLPTLGIFDGEKLTTTLDSSQITQKIQRDLMWEFVNK